MFLTPHRKFAFLAAALATYAIGPMSAELEQVRLSATAAGTTGCWHQSDQPMINNVNYQCATLRGGAPKHADASRRLGLRRPALFLPLFPRCDGRCRSVESIGNVLAYYVTARAAAHAGNLDFLLMMRTDCPYAHHVLQLVPKVVPAPLGGGAPSYEAAAAVACDGYPDTLSHKTRAWWPAVPRFRLELRAAIAAWATKNSFPPAAAYATQGSNPRPADRVPGRSCSATHMCEPRLGQAVRRRGRPP